MSKKNLIEQWYIQVVRQVFNPYLAPELRRANGVVIGHVYNHERFADGDEIRTEVIDTLDEQNNTVTTMNGVIYELGNMKPEYKTWRNKQTTKNK